MFCGQVAPIQPSVLTVPRDVPLVNGSGGRNRFWPIGALQTDVSTPTFHKPAPALTGHMGWLETGRLEQFAAQHMWHPVQEQ